MHTLLWLVLIALVGVLTFYIDRYLQQLRNTKGGPSSSASLLDNWRGFLVGRSLFGGTTANQPQLLRAWSIKAFADQPELHAWLGSLPDPAMEQLTEHVTRFCKNLDIDINWLLAQPLTQQPAVEQAVTQILTHYLGACYAAVVAYDRLTAFQQYRSFEENPYSKPSQQFATTLFETLVVHGLAASPNVEFSQAPEVERQVHRVKAITQAAEREPTRFQQALIQTIRGRTQPVKPPAKQDVANPTHKSATPPISQPNTNGVNAHPVTS